MLHINIHEAKTHLSDLIERALKGEQIILCKRNVPLAEIKPVAAKRKRAIGLYPHRLNIPDEVFAPMTDKEVEEMFCLNRDKF